MDERTHLEVRSFCAWLDAHPFEGMVEYTPAFASVTVFYDPLRLGYEDAVRQMERGVLERTPLAPGEGRRVEIPVCYGGEHGPDLEFVAAHNGLSPEDVVRIHSGEEYLVYMIGFAPGFPYLGGMSERIAAPRRSTPRLHVPAGSVGIAGAQTGVYPLETPGGWQIIGRTPERLFRPEATPPSLLQSGDRVMFMPVTPDEFDSRIL